MSEISFDPKRRLCPDGNCVGVIGPDGRCGECGRFTDNKPHAISAAATGASEPDESSSDDEGAELSAIDPGPAEGPGFDTDRRLCDDGTCVGVVGRDGRCGVCGREAV